MQAFTDWFRKLIPTTDSQQGSPLPEGLPIDNLVKDLVGQISVPNRATSVLSSIDQFQILSYQQKQVELPAVYLLLEKYLVDIDPLHKFTTQQLRDRVRNRYPELEALPNFKLIFEDTVRQELRLCQLLLSATLERIFALMGATGENLIGSTLEWLRTIPDEASLPIPLNLSGQLPDEDEGWIDLLIDLSEVLYNRIEMNLGEAATSRIFEAEYQNCANIFIGLDTFPVVINLLPDKLLDERKLSLLSSRQMQRVLLAKTQELQKANESLSKQNQALEEAQTELVIVQTEAVNMASRLGAVLDTVGEGIITVDKTGTIVFINQEVQNIWGYQPKELLGQAVGFLMPEKYQERHKQDLSRYLAIGEPKLLGQRVELEGQRKDGSIFPLELTIAETKTEQRALFTIAVRDITDRKRAEEALILARDQALEASRLKTELLAKVSHELRTPLGAILGFAEILEAGIYGQITEKQRMATSEIIDSTNYLSGIVNELLDQAQFERGKTLLRIEPFSPESMLNEVHTRMSVMATAKNITLSTYLEPGMPSLLLGDSDRLQQILVNLISNAIKFTDIGNVKVNCYQFQDSEWILEISDTGTGIPQNAQEYIFEPFQQVDGSITRRQAGTGLGLSIVKQLVQLMGGKIKLESRLGQGSTFQVILPLILVQETVHHE